jgi:methylase of polypeptide subunit release factors
MKIENDVLAVLSRADVGGNAVSLIGQLDRKLYERTNKVLEAAGGKWNRSAKAHLFDGDASARIEQIILTGDIVIPKDEFEFFPTPPAVVDLLLKRAELSPGMRVLEPSAGQGNIAVPCANAGGLVDCYELMPLNFAILSKDDRLGVVHYGDFLQAEPRAEYDRILMNPPFGRQADIKHVLHALKFLKPGGRLVSVMAASVAFREN